MVRIWLINRHSDGLFYLLIEIDQYYIEKDWFILKKIDFNQNLIEIAIVNSDSPLESESDSNQGSNLDRDFDSTTTIRFGTSNRISLIIISFLFNQYLFIYKV